MSVLESQKFKATVIATFSGVMAISPEIYQSMLEKIAKEFSVECDTAFQNTVQSILSELPSDLD